MGKHFCLSAVFLNISADILVLATAPAHADVAISSASTQNMTCSAGICAPTSADAVLNNGDLETMLASGNVTIVTTGTGVQADNIDLTAAVDWTSSSTLTLDAYDSITFSATVKDEGDGAASLVTNDGGSGGSLLFFGNGRFTISNLSDVLSINGTRYRLENDVKTLIYDITRHGNGAYALADDYADSHHKVYQTSPISVPFGGEFTGLGHSISKLEIVDGSDAAVGFFSTLLPHGILSGVKIKNAVVSGNQNLGGLVGFSSGTIYNCSVDGIIKGNTAYSGGLVGENQGVISNSQSGANVNGIRAGGIAGANEGSVESSFANGKITGPNDSNVGGLVGINSGDETNYSGTITNSYATGDVNGTKSAAGGLVGYNPEYSTVSTSYSTGTVKGLKGYVGGFAGTSTGTTTNSYWDKTTSKRSIGVGSGTETGVTGLTTEQLQSGLPAGFDPTIWGENAGINGGLPYLLNNSPD